MDGHEGFQIYGEYGSVVGKTYNPWFFAAAMLSAFQQRWAVSPFAGRRCPFFIGSNLKVFADTILNNTPMKGATVEDGIAAVRALVAISQSTKTGELCVGRCQREPLVQLGIFAKTFSRPTLVKPWMRSFNTICIVFSSIWLALASQPWQRPSTRRHCPNSSRDESRKISMAAVSGHLTMAHLTHKSAARSAPPGCAQHSLQSDGTSIITLCTGSRDPKDMWRWHAETLPRRLARYARNGGCSRPNR